jgi:hypothetical protein
MVFSGSPFKVFMLTSLAFCFVAYIGACAFSGCVFARRHNKTIFRKGEPLILDSEGVSSSPVGCTPQLVRLSGSQGGSSVSNYVKID